MRLRLQPLVITLLCILLPVLTFRTTYEGYFSLLLKVMILMASVSSWKTEAIERALNGQYQSK